MPTEIDDLQKRINRLENFFWVALVLAIAFGVGGAGLWTTLQSAKAKADELDRRLTELKKEFDAGLPRLVEDAQTGLINTLRTFRARSWFATVALELEQTNRRVACMWRTEAATFRFRTSVARCLCRATVIRMMRLGE